MSAPAAKLERVACRRCGGTGRMPYAVAGGVCFNCGGSGSTLTKRGAAASTYLYVLRCKRADALVPGDVVRHDGFTAGSLTVPTTWHTVTSVEPETMPSGRSRGADGEWQDYPLGLVLACDGFAWGGVRPETLVRVRQSAEAAARTLAAALAYQETLTKSGKPRAQRGARREVVA